MKSAPELFVEQFLQMRERCLSLAADLDRLARAPGGLAAAAKDPRFHLLHAALQVLQDDAPDHVRRVLDLMSDQSPLSH